MTTTLVTPSDTADIDDGPAIAELHRLLAAQKAAFLADPYPAAGRAQRTWAPWPSWSWVTATRSGRP